MVRWSEYGIFPRKPPHLTRSRNNFCVICDSTRAWTHIGELTEWFRDSSLNLLSLRQTELQYIHEEWQIFIENCPCFIQLVLLYEQKTVRIKNCMQQVLTTWKAVWTDLYKHMHQCLVLCHCCWHRRYWWNSWKFHTHTCGKKIFVLGIF